MLDNGIITSARMRSDWLSYLSYLISFDFDQFLISDICDVRLSCPSNWPFNRPLSGARAVLECLLVVVNICAVALRLKRLLNGPKWPLLAAAAHQSPLWVMCRDMVQP